MYTITPGSTVEGESESVVLTGAGFDDSTSVYIGDLPLSDLLVVNPATITGQSPIALAVGLHDVGVSEPGDSAILVSAFEVLRLRNYTAEEGGDKGGCATVSASLTSGMGLLIAILGLARRRERL